MRQAGNAGVEQLGKTLARRADAIGNAVQPLIDSIAERHAAFIDAVNKTGTGFRNAGAQTRRYAKDVLTDDVAGLIEFFLQRLMGAGNRGTNALGMDDDCFALAAKTVDEIADAAFIVGIGAFDLVDLGVNQCFQFDSARQCALDAFTHGLNFATHSLADRHDAVGGQMFRLGKTDGNFCHGLGGDAHFLRPADHHRKTPKHDNGNNNRHE